mmetsp:Transcript_5841/g.9699  ORF Transcript_5841/g.9699 Transcript_5841/m.9699 type:complete len:300 (+) Transcript_5841:57-956(+)|eukprot:CAMPEP_0119013524 /NCGR_PEP_ID=MMETSP1176-20130426/8494_1 /TAXON_ID=265551 /ORGANISM="Synedropsis recta cf, Strain CCMP1620" /LENGTH=299 /DNA_ID=CAMNT_0006966617 /DNA_START=57 /DNA_END=956 /DNA_ORIENTATION=+
MTASTAFQQTCRYYTDSLSNTAAYWRITFLMLSLVCSIVASIEISQTMKTLREESKPNYGLHLLDDYHDAFNASVAAMLVSSASVLLVPISTCIDRRYTSLMIAGCWYVIVSTLVDKKEHLVSSQQTWVYVAGLYSAVLILCETFLNAGAGERLCSILFLTHYMQSISAFHAANTACPHAYQSKNWGQGCDQLRDPGGTVIALGFLLRLILCPPNVSITIIWQGVFGGLSLIHLCFVHMNTPQSAIILLSSVVLCIMLPFSYKRIRGSQITIVDESSAKYGGKTDKDETDEHEQVALLL